MDIKTRLLSLEVTPDLYDKITLMNKLEIYFIEMGYDKVTASKMAKERVF